MKTAIWLYLFSFIAVFDLHAQYPILTPFAVSLGAAPSFIGLMMGMYSITHLPGNLIAGYSVDRFGSRPFIVLSLLLAGGVLLLQSRVTDPWQLLALRSVSGFVLAFLSPACMALLARITADQVGQGKLMAGNGLVHTLASVVSPAAGALLVARIGFEQAFYVLGWILIATAACALAFIRDIKKQSVEAAKTAEGPPAPATGPMPWLVYALPVAMACAQGILSFELPLMAHDDEGILTTGILFSVISLGALFTLSLLFLNRYSPYARTLTGAFFLSLTFFAVAIRVPLPLEALLLLIGMAKGIIYPALSSLLIQLSGGVRYGRTFSILSVAFSVGAFLGPMLAGMVRDFLSPYFIGFAVLMLAVCVLPLHRIPGHSASPPAPIA
ncbi:MFS transporter [Paenibacillus darwinianus]|uniref:MFS transporter n=1 Tax=Paenibacillus darwinianus TaxID=1380763 RepID=A0A9W5S2U8_9BACL|nr:MFS transporter [Paenibacillus darwinianus]EXX87685.1 MFS transporter [Paenibacillus darwinianus]EXX89304.1 MFS transporter [Paenibacillus darwinianus]EXX90119.1 MFS transporter [Paenibacillus darwinianus]